MNEQSVLYIINYFNQYPDQPPEVLVQNIISSGYNMTDLKEALRRMGISPIVIPGYKEPVPVQSKSSFPKMPLIIIGVISLLIISGLSVWAFMNSQKKVQKKENIGTIQQGVIEQKPATPSATLESPFPSRIYSPLPMPTALPTKNAFPLSENPFKIGDAAFVLNDYKVRVKQYLVPDSDTIGTPETLVPQENTELSAIQYFKKGTLVRHEINSYGTYQISIMTDQYDIYLYPDKKQFIKTVKSGNTYGTSYGKNPVSFFSFIYLLSLAPQIDWNKTAPYEWVGRSKERTIEEVKITLDPDTKLFKRLWMNSKTDGTIQWMVMEYEYEKIEDIDSLLKIPEGYTEKSTNVSVTP